MSISSDSAQKPVSAWPFVGLPRRIVVKLGSNVLSTKQGTLDFDRINTVSRQVSRLVHQGSQVIIVTSGAVAAGMGVCELAARPRELPLLQGLAAIGQCQLMGAYGRAFSEHGVKVAQVLITRGDLEDRRRYLNAHHTLDALLALPAVPIINENDTVITEELTFGDNDMLSAVIAAKMHADLLVILTDIDGLFTANPKADPTARLIDSVSRITPDIEALATGAGSAIGRGGMITKITAARHATSFGVTTVIANGKRDSMLDEVLTGAFRGTLFLSSRSGKGRGKDRVHWISMKKPRGTLVVDAGAVRALRDLGKSLLPVGVVDVQGRFAPGDVVAIRSESGEDIARGITNFAADQVALLRGHKGPEFATLLGSDPDYEEVVHRNNLHVY